MKFRFKALVALAAVGIVFSAATAQAVIQMGLNQINYLNDEALTTYNDATHTYTNTSTIAVGDHLYGVLASTTETNNSPPLAAGVFDLVIAQILPTFSVEIVGGVPTIVQTGVELLLTSDNAVLTTPGPGNSATGGFLTGSAGTTYTLADGTTINGLGQAVGTMDATYQGSTLLSQNINTTQSNNVIPMPTASASQATGITNASNGTLYADFGFGNGALLSDTSATSMWGAPGVGYWASDVTFTGSVDFVAGLQTLTQPNSNFVPLYNEKIPVTLGGESTGADGTNIHNNTGNGNPLTPALTDSPPTAFTFIVYGTASDNVPAYNAALNSGFNPGFSSPTGTSPWPTNSSDPSWIDPKTPEPGTMLMMGMGLAFGLPYLRRRKAAA